MCSSVGADELAKPEVRVFSLLPFIPMPGQAPKGMFAHSAIISVATKEEKAVAKTRPSKFRPVTDRMLGLTATVRERRVRREKSSVRVAAGMWI